MENWIYGCDKNDIYFEDLIRFDYEYKVKTWYYGTEDGVSDNVTIGNAIGWEYLLNYSFIRERGEKFNNQNKKLLNRCLKS